MKRFMKNIEKFASILRKFDGIIMKCQILQNHDTNRGIISVIGIMKILLDLGFLQQNL